MSNEIEGQMKQIEVSIKQAEDAVKAKTKMLRLIKNKDFKELVSEGYLKDEAVRLVLLKADPQLQSEADQAQIIKEIDAIGAFREYIRTVIGMGKTAEHSLEADRQTREELLAEDLAADADEETEA